MTSEDVALILQRISNVQDAVDAIRAQLHSHIQNYEAGMTNLDLGLRAEMSTLGSTVGLLDANIDELKVATEATRDDVKASFEDKVAVAEKI